MCIGIPGAIEGGSYLGILSQDFKSGNMKPTDHEIKIPKDEIVAITSSVR